MDFTNKTIVIKVIIYRGFGEKNLQQFFVTQSNLKQPKSNNISVILESACISKKNGNDSSNLVDLVHFYAIFFLISNRIIFYI